jgi:DNA mismatch repair protein MutL
MSLLAEHKKIFLQNGLEMEPFGPNSVVIHTLPYFINPGEVQENIRETLALIGEFDSRENLQKMERKLLGSKSCKSAIKKGHRISNLEADSLLKDLFLCAEPTRCPHGRPVLIGFDMSYLDKLFKRIL